MQRTNLFREYSYNASEADSKLSARAIAITQVKELLLAELVSNLYDRLQKKEWLKVDYKYENFKNDFNREMENFENQRI